MEANLTTEPDSVRKQIQGLRDVHNQYMVMCHPERMVGGVLSIHSASATDKY
jgi:hypothetical protein